MVFMFVLNQILLNTIHVMHVQMKAPYLFLSHLGNSVEIPFKNHLTVRHQHSDYRLVWLRRARDATR